ncbi:MAG TPA: bifunctional (p)ppGpp synthetase/guanosine-3',5'-bis(diphosphate) 3'-pyrophosphohydrolase [Fibrobacteraceae bacterium]|nr:bifunctional (p)ppGpp synthetase/guanosine-3',5'-bis(diphosphate) 3'-pyrophosphohydrolase [Fibrobacteraceae bacterium]
METAEEISQKHFVDGLVSKNPELDGARILDALRFMAEAHRNQFRKSGTPYIEHPLETAKILANLKLDTETVLAGLLHDVVEDTQFNLEEIQNRFGAEVAFMVDAVTKISGLQVSTTQDFRQERKIATYRKFFVSMAKDPRVIMIKLADRLHNLRTLHYMKPEKRKEIAKESLEIYAPLTHRFGLHRIKWEMEDLALKHLDPEGYKNVVEKLQQSRQKREAYIASVIVPLEMKLRLEGLECNISGRPKHVYSIYLKTRSRNCTVDDLFDLFAIRIVVNTIPECYVVLGHVHNMWAPMQSRFKDYIATPKPNLYQSLHTTVIGPEGKMVEVQIRTREMDQTAENGFAAHWAYKLDPSEGHNLEWLQNIAKAQSEITDSKEFFEFLHMDLKPTQITVLTPRGDQITLPSGATVLDFAFAVHTELGTKCVGARVDGLVVGIDKVLVHGETVHILRNAQQEPSQDWMSIVITHKAKLALRRKLRIYRTAQAMQIGKLIYDRELALLQVPQPRQPASPTVAEAFQSRSVDEFFESVGNGNIRPADIEKYLLPLAGEKALRRRERGLLSFLRRDADGSQVPIHVDSNMSSLLQIAHCCSPLPGDKIAGIMVPGKGVEIHKEGCRILRNQAAANIIAMEWQESARHLTQAKFEVLAADRDGLLEDLVRVIRKQEVSIEKASIVTLRDSVRDRFTVKVYNLAQLEMTLQGLRQLPNVKKVIRL